MSYVEVGGGGFHQHVIYIHFHGRSNLFLEHPVDQPLICGPCVLEPEGHHTVAIGSLCCDERGLFLVIWIHADLIVAGESIHKTEEFMASCSIYDEVDPRQGEAILWACSVDISEVDAESPLAIRFFDEYNVGQPLGIFHLSDCPCLEEFADLLVDLFLPLWREAPSFLLDWFEGWADVHPMSDYCGVNPSHISLLPCEDIFVLFKKMSERVFEVLC